MYIDYNDYVPGDPVFEFEQIQTQFRGLKKAFINANAVVNFSCGKKRYETHCFMTTLQSLYNSDELFRCYRYDDMLGHAIQKFIAKSNECANRGEFFSVADTSIRNLFVRFGSPSKYHTFY